MKKTKSKAPASPSLPEKGSRMIKIVLTAIFIVVAFSFFAFIYPYHLHYQEELQMFEWTKLYASGIFSVPGGLASYLSRFCVQFFYYTYAGAAIMAILIGGVQLATWTVMPRRSIGSYLLSFVPALIMWAFLCYENAMLSAPIALILTVVASTAACTLQLKKAGNKAKRYDASVALSIVTVVVMYWLCGPLALLLPVIVALRAVNSDIPKGLKIGCTAAAIIVAALCPPVFHSFVPYPTKYLYSGIGYCRHISFFPTLAWAAGIAVIAVQALSMAIPVKWKKQKSEYVLSIITALLVAISGALLILSNTDMDKEEVFEYDYLASQQKWQKITALAAKNPPTSQMSVIYTNLALAKNGELNETLLDFYQNGTDGLLTHFGENFFLPFATAEAYYQMGLTKPAQLFTYEIQQSIPDAQRSVRVTKRLAEIYLINGEYDLARKYLKSLTHTLFYKDWAEKRLKFCGDDHAVETNPEYGPKRQAGYSTDIMFSDANPAELLTTAVADHPGNRMIFDYLVAWHLLGRDIEPLPEIMALGADVKYAKLPKALQQALALQWAHDHNDFEGMPYELSPEVKADFISFSKVYRPGITSSMLPPDMQRTYWGYYFNE